MSHFFTGTRVPQNRTGASGRRGRVNPGALGTLFVALTMITALFGGAQSAMADGSGNADVLTGQGCMEDVAGFGLNCTANDVQLASAQNIVILDDGCAFIGDTVTFTADFEILLTAQARHDVGIWFAEDGDPNGDGAISGACTAATPAYAPDPPWLDLDGTSDDPGGVIQDTCGDIDANHNPLFPSVTLTVTCIDPDGNGKLNLPKLYQLAAAGRQRSVRQPGGGVPGGTIEVPL